MGPTTSPTDDPAGATTGSADWAGRRADARRNHEKVLAAAVEVFTEHGLGATIPQVAARAGVGRATVYRSFPTKADLVAALAQVHVDWLNARIAAAAEAAETNAYRALESTLEDVTTRLAEDRLMVEVLSGAEVVEDPDSTRHVERIMQLGIQQGSLRPDATGLDIKILLAGVARTLLELDVRDPAVWRRYARFAVAALRP